MTGVVERHETLGAAAGRMVAEDLTCLVALESGFPRGLVTERELVQGVLCERIDRSERLDAVPWRPLVAAAQGAHASDAVWLMESHALRHVPVADENGAIVGMLAFEDALARVLEEITMLAARAATSVTAAQRVGSGRRRPALEARDVQTPASYVDADVSARDVAECMRASAAESLVVRDGTRAVGLVTERDLLRELVAGAVDADGVCARDLATRPLLAVAPNEPLDRVLGRMADHSVRSVGVVGYDGCSLGIVSLGNLLTSLTIEMAARIELAGG